MSDKDEQVESEGQEDEGKTLTDADVLSGGPGVGPEHGDVAPGQEASEDRSSVKIGDREFNLDSQTAQALDALTKNIGDRIEGGFQKLSRQQPAAPSPPQAPQTPPAAPKSFEERIEELNLESQLYDDPRGTLKKFAQAIREDVTTEVQNQYRQDQGRQHAQQFWDRFYIQHREFNRADDHALLSAVLAQEATSIQGMTREEEVHKHIVEAAQKMYLNMQNRANTKPATVEGGNRGQPPQRKTVSKDASQPEDERVIPMREHLRRRKAERRKAAKAG